MPPKRQTIELKRLNPAATPGIEVAPDEADVNVWHVTMTAPDEYMPRGASAARPSPYAGRKFGVVFTFPEKYPFDHPTPKFKPGALYHPMCELSSGTCCADFLKNSWGAGKFAIDALKAIRDNRAQMDGTINGEAIHEMESGDFAALEAKARAAAGTEPAV